MFSSAAWWLHLFFDPLGTHLPPVTTPTKTTRLSTKVSLKRVCAKEPLLSMSKPLKTHSEVMIKLDRWCCMGFRFLLNVVATKTQGYIYKVESTWTLQGYLLVVSSTFSLEGYMKPPLDESKSWTLLSGFHPFNRSCDSIGFVHGHRPAVELMDSKWSLSALSGNKPNGHYNSYRPGNISLTSLQNMLENYPDITFRLQPYKNLLQAKLLVNLVHRPSTLKKSSDQNGWRAKMHCNLCGLRHVYDSATCYHLPAVIPS